MSSEILGGAENTLKGNLGGAWDIKHGYADAYTDLGIARKFGGSAAAYSLRDIGAMNGRVVKVRRIQDDAVEDFSALQVASGSIEKFAIGQDVLDLYNNAAYFPTDSDYFSLGSGITLSGAFTISYDVVFTGSFGTNTSRIFQDDAGNDFLTFTASNVCKFRVGATVRTMTALSTALQLGRKYSMIFARDGSGVYTLTVDGVVLSTTSATDTDDFLIQRIGFRNRGSISNLNINSGQHIYAGDGAENSNWLDTGSGTTTNATKVGTPVAFTGQGIDAFVDTWFDQSGSSSNATQSTTTQQPKILENGGIVKNVKGFPSLKFESANLTELDIGLLISNLNSVSAYVVTQKDDGDTNVMAGFTQGVSNDNSRFYLPFYTTSLTPNLGYNNSAAKISFGTTLTGTCNLYSAFSGDTNIEAFKNGSSVGTTALVDKAVTADTSKIGQLSNSFYLDGKISEIFLTTKKLQSDAAVINNDVVNYYNL
jgi:hypothetical protein